MVARKYNEKAELFSLRHLADLQEERRQINREITRNNALRGLTEENRELLQRLDYVQ